MNVTQECIESKSHGRAAVISPHGEVDMHESPKLRKALIAEIAKTPSVVIVDLADVSFIDSSGVATLVEAMKLAKAGGARLVLCGMRPNVLDVFALARLDKVFVLAASRTEALA